MQEIFGLLQLGALGPCEPHPLSWPQSAAAYLPTDGTRFSTSSLLSEILFPKLYLRLDLNDHIWDVPHRLRLNMKLLVKLMHHAM